ncbi:hypothetical protein Ddye_007572 [Dipteronia dyeriana]|uniref:CRC domain-containing protein n=1 Tax=Dipteronia dyeriana TaxID=168575 RepID=A0AAD9XKC5_9ROSI|nr:hypothetical protein Ddye_007572 [Dipteronia dyeriana]
MDSPEVTVKTTAAASAGSTVQSSNSPPVQESPFSNFLRNLSPIEPVKAQHVSQGFLGLNSPPLAFTSPRINALREASSLKRPRYHLFPSADVSANDDGCKKSTDCAGELGKSDSLLDGRLVADTQKDGDMKNFAQVQPDISLGRVGEYLANRMEVDCANSTTYEVNPDLEQSVDLLQSSVSSITYLKGSISKSDNNNGMEIKVNAHLTLSGKAEEQLQGESTEEQECGALPPDECNTESNFFIDLASKKQECDTSAQNEGSVHEGKSACHPQLLPEPFQIAQTYEDSEENAGTIELHGLVDTTMHDTEANQHQRGFSRRCLQFVEAQPKAIVSSSNSSNQKNDVTSLRAPATPAELVGLDSSHLDLNATSSQRQLGNLSQPVTPLFPPRHSGKSPLTISKPPGIGLHLNSIVNALPKGGAATVGIKLAISECGIFETNASVAVSSMISESQSIGHLNLSQSLGDHETPPTERKFNSEHADNFEELNQLSPKKKRKKSSTIDSDGCKRCNCKKTQCLKLYCDCFAAGIYCADSCTCQGCRNRPEYEDTVLETRQQIESRNPLAFAPKIVQHANDIPVNNGDDGNRLMPSSAKHNRGCNCKKSMCLKKYCECYQANVGCSDGCRCEGCKNSYGRKEDYVRSEEMLGNRACKERSEVMFDNKLELVTSKKDFLRAEFYDPHLTPLTPSLQCSDQGKDAPKSRFLSRRYVPSPDSDPTIISSYANTPRSQKNSDSNGMLLETSKEIVDVDSYGQGMDYRNEDVMDQLSSRGDALADLCHLTPLPGFPSMAVSSSGSSKATDWKDISGLQLYPRSDSLSSSRSLHWRGSPVTPITQLSGNKNIQDPDSDSRVYDISEDDTPDILREAYAPMKSVKVSSPNRKRVSPPQNRVNEIRSSTSVPLKSRKFILRAVSSFPPLTPCIDSKSSTDQNRSDFQENKE